MFSEDPILLPEIVDQIVLVTVHPASEREDEELQRRRHSLRLLGRLDQHRPSLGRFFAPYGDFHFGCPGSMQLYTQYRARRPNTFGAGVWAGSWVHITAERAGSDITPEHFSDTSPALRPCNPERGPISTRQTLRSLSAMRPSR